MASDVFDVPKVRRFVQLMKDFDLSELELRQGEMCIALKRGTASPVVTAGAAAAQVVSAPAAAETPVAPVVPAGDPDYILPIPSPIVGTFYSKPNPAAPAFANVGDTVSEEKTVCIIEAMKVMNQIPAGVSGKIVAVLAKDGQAVEYGQPLFKVDTRG